MLLTSCGQEGQYQIPYWHLVVKHGNFTFLMTSSGQALYFHIPTDI